MRVFNLKFNKESNGCWYIDLPCWPFAHHNLMMVAGADLLCEYVSEVHRSPGHCEVRVTVKDNRLDGRAPDICLRRTEKGYGATYKIIGAPVEQCWLCPVTLFVLGRYPNKINIYLERNS